MTTRMEKFVSWCMQYARTLWLICLVFAIPATLRTASLYAHLRSDVDALLPQNTESVRAVNELRARLSNLSHLGVIVDTESLAQLPEGERFIDELATRIRAYPKDLVRRVRVGNAEESAFFDNNASVYVDLKDLEEIRVRIERRRDFDVAKEQGAQLEDDEPAPPLDFSDIQKKYDERAAGKAKTEGHRFSSKSMHMTLLVVDVAESGHGKSSALLDRVQRDVADLNLAKYGSGMRVGYTGDVAINVEETRALMGDLSLSSVLVFFFVGAVIALYYRWWKSVLILVPPLLVATVFAFALASLPPFNVTELNSNTAFLGSIIVGNGINFGIVLLARYVEERRAGRDVRHAMRIAAEASRAGTLSAALAAGASYAALASTDFQGFRQFGIIGGIGMVMSWLAAYVLMPPLAVLVDRGALPTATSSQFRFTTYVSRLVARAPHVIVLATLALTVGAALSLRKFGPDSIETDYSKLRRKDTWVSGEGYWGRKMDEMLGTYLTPIVILASDEEQATKIGDDMREATKEAPLKDSIAGVRTLSDLIPQDQDAKLAKAAEIRELLTPKIRSLISKDKKSELDRFLGNEDEKPVTLKDVPEVLLTGLREKDGRVGATVLVFPKPTSALWRGREIAEIVTKLRAVAKDGRVAGSLAVSADILASIKRDGPRASLFAFLGVAATVVLLFRRSKTSLLVLGSLIVGVLWLFGASQFFHVRINFANFIAFPITFGIGVDYAVNVVQRWEADGRRDFGAAIRTTGGAVALCSLTTIIGYSSLLIAENRALYLFGLLAVLGEVCCLTTALVALPAFVSLTQKPITREHVTR